MRTESNTISQSCRMTNIWQTDVGTQIHVWLHTSTAPASSFKSQHHQITIQNLHNALDGTYKIDKIDTVKDAIGIRIGTKKKLSCVELEAARLAIPRTHPTFSLTQQLSKSGVSYHRLTLANDQPFIGEVRQFLQQATDAPPCGLRCWSKQKTPM